MPVSKCGFNFPQYFAPLAVPVLVPYRPLLQVLAAGDRMPAKFAPMERVNMKLSDGRTITDAEVQAILASALKSAKKRVAKLKLTKMEQRKLTALCKAVGNDLGHDVFFQWYVNRPAMGAPVDNAAILIADALEPLRDNKTVKPPLHGFIVKRARRIGGAEPARGFTVTRAK